MAYDEKVAERIRTALSERRDVVEKRMFGGIAFMLNDAMAIGVAGEDLMVRVGPDRYEEALAQPHARPMDFTGRPLVGYVFVGPRGFAQAAALRKWLAWSAAFVATLPPKKKKTVKKPKR